MLQSERRLRIFHENVEKVFADVDCVVRPVRVMVPGEGEADVALKVQMSSSLDRVIARGIARYLSGRVVGEKHIKMLQLDPGWMVGHSHGLHGEARCLGFIYDEGQFVLSELLRGREALGEIELRDNSLDWNGEILNGLLTTDSSASVFAPDGGAALRRARLLRGTGAVNELLVDAALRQALDDRLAATEG